MPDHHRPPASRRSDKTRADRRHNRLRRRKHTVAARDRILYAAEELIAEHGFDATPTARIAERADVPKGLVFHYFPTKMGLLVTLISERASIEPFGADEVEVAAGDVATTLSRLAERFRGGLHASARMRRLIFREAETHPEVRAFVSGLHRDAVRHVRAVIDTALAGWSRAEEIAQHQRDAVAETFAALLLHEASLSSMTGKTFDLEAIAKLLAAGLQAPPPTGAPA